MTHKELWAIVTAILAVADAAGDAPPHRDPRTGTETGGRSQGATLIGAKAANPSRALRIKILSQTAAEILQATGNIRGNE